MQMDSSTLDNVSLQDLATTIVIPSRNEDQFIASVIRDCWAMRPRNAQIHFLIMDDASSDGTSELLKLLAADLPIGVIRHETPMGFGGSIRDGIRHVDTPWVLLVDADAQYEPADVSRFLSVPRVPLTMVSGWRKHRADPLIRIFISLAFRLMNRIAFDLRMKDITSSLKLLPTEQAKEISRRVKYMNGSFWSEFMVRWTRAGYQWTELRIDHLPRVGSRSKVFATGEVGRLVVHQFVGFLRLLRELSLADGDAVSSTRPISKKVSR